MPLSLGSSPVEAKTVTQLRALCKGAGLAQNGSKAQLVARLQEASSGSASSSSGEGGAMAPPSARPARRSAREAPQQQQQQQQAPVQKTEPNCAAAPATPPANRVTSRATARMLSATPATRTTSRRWAEPTDVLLKKYFAIYERFDDSAFHLVYSQARAADASAMRGLTVSDVARRLFELKAVTADRLFRWLPDLEEEDPFYATAEYQTASKKRNSAMQLTAKMVLGEVPLSHDAFEFLMTQLDDCAVMRGVGDLSLDSTHHSNAHEIYTTTEEERQLVHNRWTPKLLKAMGLEKKAGNSGGEGEPQWTVPASMDLDSLQQASKFLKTYREKALREHATREADRARTEAAKRAQQARQVQARQQRLQQFENLVLEAPDTGSVFGAEKRPVARGGSPASKRRQAAFNNTATLS
jgi:SAP domain